MWISSKRFDLCWIILPAFISSFLIFFLKAMNLIPTEVSPLNWLILVVFIDVSHVWSTIYRTYLNRNGLQKFSNALWLVPLSCYLAGVLLHSIGQIYFWSTLAYLAVFHFIRQQYGIFMMYQNKVSKSKFYNFDKIAIYSATIFPILLWHLKGMQDFHWFIKNDFFYYKSLYGTPVYNITLIVGLLIPMTYFLKEVLIEKNSLLMPKNLFLLGTFLSWWTGIIWIPNDFSFTTTNIIGHGIPYFALIYLFDLQDRGNLTVSRKVPTFLLFFLLFLIGFIEEGFWDGLIWKDHQGIFVAFRFLPFVENISLKALLVPLLSLPQATHYILDGMIWKNKIQ